MEHARIAGSAGRASSGGARGTLRAAIGLVVLASSPAAQTVVNGQMDGSADFSSWNEVVPAGWSPNALGSTDLWNETTAFGSIVWVSSAGGGPFVHGIASPSNNEGIEQTVTGLTVGESYTVRFEQAATNSSWTTDDSGFWRVTFGGEALDSDPIATPILGAAGPWVSQALTFTATASSQVLVLEAYNGTSGLRADLGVDSVRIEAGCGASVPGLETVRLGAPPNPFALLPVGAGPPVIGQVWDPGIDHTTFVPDAVLDLYALYLFPANVPFPPAGTVLGSSLAFSQVRLPSASLQLPLPNDCSLVDLRLSVQALSFDRGLDFYLTNALDVTIGTF